MNNLFGAALLILSALIAWITANHYARRFGSGRKKLFFFLPAIVSGCTCVSWLRYGTSMIPVQTLILATLLCCMSYSDIKTHTVDDSLHLMVLLTSLIGLSVDRLFPRAATAILVGGVLLLIAVLCGKGVGGADIKFLTVCAFLLPPSFYFLGIFAGLLSALILKLPFLRKGAAEGIPMLPYLSSGVMLAFLLSI